MCAVIVDAEGRYLVAQRPPHKHLGLKWEFPGGKVEPQEEPAAALAREIKEELGCEILVGAALAPFTHDYSTVVIEMLPFMCVVSPRSPKPHPHEHVAVTWVMMPELETLDLAPADWPVVAQLKSRESEK